MRLLKPILLTLLLLGIASAAAVDFTPLIPITAVVVVIFLAIMNMLASAISSPQIGAWVKAELRELIAGVLLAVIIITFFISSRGIASAITGTGDYINQSAIIIDKILSDSEVGYDRAFQDVIRAGSKVRVTATYAPYLALPLGPVNLIYSEAPLAGVSPLLSSLAAATQGLANNILLFEAIRLLIKLAETAIPTVLLPVGLCLRLIPFSRSIGNSIIAICIGAMVFLPFSVILIDAMHGAIDYPEAHMDTWDMLRLDFMLDYGGQGALMAGEILCGSKILRLFLGLNEFGFGLLVCIWLLFIPGFGYGAFINCFGILTPVGLEGGWATSSAPYGIYGNVIDWSSYIYMFIVAGSLAAIQVQSLFGVGYASRAFDLLYEFLRQINNLTVLGFLDIAVIAIVTLTGTRSVSAALGGEWYLAGIQRLI